MIECDDIMMTKPIATDIETNCTEIHNTEETENLKGELTEAEIALGIVNKDLWSLVAVCRICMEPGIERLVSPCNCKGSLANVHVTCLEMWLNEVKRDYCELCKFKYPTVYSMEYTILEALEFWICDPMIGQFLGVSMFVTALLVVLDVGLQYVLNVATEHGLSFPITEYACRFNLIVLFLIHILVAYRFWKSIYNRWIVWKSNHVHLTLVLDASTDVT